MTKLRSVGRLAATVLVAALIATGTYAQPNDRIEFGGRDLWVSGSNVAWVDFARDIGPGTTQFDRFEQIFSELRANGGNALRLWLHTTGEHTPEWSGVEVVGPGQGAIDDLRVILDLAYAYDVGLMLALWSHDMLDVSRPTSVTDRSLGILTNENLLQTYIENALVPMVDSLRGHPAILAWEIFNEAEGFSEEYGWSSRHRVPMTAIQRFVNRTAGAIRRTDPEARVTTGTWKMAMLSDVGTFHNYYTDARLAEVGGDDDGFLDFYTVHYYADFGSSVSPFVHDYDYWGLDKPLIIAEFYTENTFRTVRNTIPYDRLYESLYDRGYAGALAWQWFNYPSSGEGATHWPRILENTRNMFDMHRDAVELFYPGLRARLMASREHLELGQSALLRWSSRDATSVTLNDVPVSGTDSLEVTPEATTLYRLVAADEEGDEVIREVTITVVDPAVLDRAVGRPALASSTHQSSDPSHATDGDDATSWESAAGNAEWLYVDLGSVFALNRVMLAWGDLFGLSFDIEVSYDARRWTRVHEERNGQGGTDDISIDGLPEARFVRMRGLESSGAGGYAIRAFRVFGLTVDDQPSTIVLTSPVAGVFDGGEMMLSADVVPSAELDYVLFTANGDSVGAVTSAPFELPWRPDPGWYAFSAIVYQTDGRAGRSEAVMVEVRPERERIRYEVSQATYTGDVALVSLPQASDGTLLEMRDSGTITWSDIQIAQAGRFDLVIGYRLPFGDKWNHVRINGAHVAEVGFTGAVNTILTTSLEVDLVAGANSVQIAHSWGWMQFDYIEVVGNGQSVSSGAEDAIPRAFVLGGNYPNPFNPTTVIPFEVSRPSHVRIEVFDVTGRRVAVVQDGYRAAGSHAVVFDATGLSSGIYVYRMTAEGATEAGRMVLIK
jgi:hypothetical protein